MKSQWPLFILLFCSPLLLADVSPWEKAEVKHLLQFVNDTPCQVERNGEKYNGPDAAEQMLKKYQHFIDDIKSTNDFIAKTASKSDLNGQVYMVYCAGVPAQPSADWLKHELIVWRSTHNK